MFGKLASAFRLETPNTKHQTLVLQILDLPVFQFDWRRSTEDVDHDRHAAVRLVDPFDGTLEIREHAVVDANAITRLVRNLELRRLFGLLVGLLEGRLFGKAPIDAEATEVPESEPEGDETTGT